MLRSLTCFAGIRVETSRNDIRGPHGRNQEGTKGTQQAPSHHHTVRLRTSLMEHYNPCHSYNVRDGTRF